MKGSHYFPKQYINAIISRKGIHQLPWYHKASQGIHDLYKSKKEKKKKVFFKITIMIFIVFIIEFLELVTVDFWLELSGFNLHLNNSKQQHL